MPAVIQMTDELSAGKGPLHAYSSSSDLLISLQLIWCRCGTCESNPESVQDCIPHTLQQLLSLISCSLAEIAHQ